MAMLVITRWYIHMLPFNMVIMACLKYPAQDVNLWLVRTSIYSKKQIPSHCATSTWLIGIRCTPMMDHYGLLWVIIIPNKPAGTTPYKKKKTSQQW